MFFGKNIVAVACSKDETTQNPKIMTTLIELYLLVLEENNCLLSTS